MSATVSRAVARRDDGSRSHGPLEKAAIIMLALDEERSRRLFAELDEDAIRRVSHAMARLGRMPMELVDADGRRIPRRGRPHRQRTRHGRRN